MLIPHTRDTVHRAWLLRLLSAIVDDRVLMTYVRFKGGTCAAMRNLLDRFSVDLDFDLLSESDILVVRHRLEAIFTHLDLTIKDPHFAKATRGEKSTVVPQYFLRYNNDDDSRNTIALDITVPPPRSNEYEIIRLADIDRFVPCQTVATMVANKLVTPLDRYAKHGTIAGRDIYDIHQFLFQGLPWNTAVIEERSGTSSTIFFQRLHQFIAKRVTQTVIDQDINTLLPADHFQKIRRLLKDETLSLLAAYF